MDSHDIRTLRVLEALEREGHSSQRELARKLGVSLGLVNAFLKRMARKGYFKITNLPANRIRYILTPQGLAEKTRLTYEYVHYSFSYYRQTRAKFKKALAELARKSQLRIVFWGNGELAEIAYISLQEIPKLEFVGMVECGKSGDELFGKKTIEPEELKGINFDRVIITAISSGAKIYEDLRKLGIPDSKILLLKADDDQ